MADFCQEYTNYKNAKIMIAKNNRVVAFKPFLEELSYERSVETKNQKSVFGAFSFFGDAKASNKLSFKVVADGFDEAKSNHIKFQKLFRMIVPPLSIAGTDQALVSRIYVKFANLIHAEKNTPFNAENYNLIKLTGMEFDISGLEYKPDLEMGFFDSNGIILAKTFDISLNLSVTDPVATGQKFRREQRRDQNEPGKMFGFPVPWDI